MSYFIEVKSGVWVNPTHIASIEKVPHTNVRAHQDYKLTLANGNEIAVSGDDAQVVLLMISNAELHRTAE